MRIIFMGTPDFAVESLRILVESNYNIVAVITAPDKPSGRGKKINQSPVKQYAVSKSIPVLQPPKLKNPAFLDELKSYKADLQVVVAFRMLPELVWAMPKFGTFNLHGSLLPQYRGAAPINWAVINGEKETGVTTFFIEKEIDTGKIIYKAKAEISETDTAGTIHDKLMVLGATLVLKTVRAIENNDYPQIEQEEFEQLKPAPKIFKEDCEINWLNESEDIYNFIRGLSPYPGAWSSFKNESQKQSGVLKIFASEIENFSKKLEPKEIDTDNKTYLHVGTKNGRIAIQNIQVPGKKRLNIADFLRGYDASYIELT